MADSGGGGPSDYAVMAETRNEARQEEGGGQQGFASLGAALGGGGLTTGGPGSSGTEAGQMAYARGQQIGAATVNALSQARNRITEAAARQAAADTLPQFFASTGLLDPVKDAPVIENYRQQILAGTPPQQIMAELKEKGDETARQTLGNPNAKQEDREAAAARLGYAGELPKATGTAGSFETPLRGPGQNPVTVSPQQSEMNQATIGQKQAQTANAGQMYNMGDMKVGDMNDPTWAAHIIAVANGQLPPTGPTSRFFGKMGLQEQRDVLALNPNFSGYQYSANSREASTIMGGQTGVNTDASINRVAQHLNLFDQAVKEMDAGNVQASNGLMAKVKTLFGSGAPTALTELAQFIGTESMKSAAGMSAGTHDEREAISSGLAQHNSPDQFLQDRNAIAHLVRGQADARALQWANASHVDNYYQRNLLPSTRQSLGIDDNAHVEGWKPRSTSPAPAGGQPIAGGGQPAGSVTPDNPRGVAGRPGEPPAQASDNQPAGGGRALPGLAEVQAELKRRGVQVP